MALQQFQEPGQDVLHVEVLCHPQALYLLPLLSCIQEEVVCEFGLAPRYLPVFSNEDDIVHIAFEDPKRLQLDTARIDNEA